MDLERQNLNPLLSQIRKKNQDRVKDGRYTYQGIRERNNFRNDEPLKSVPNETHKRSDEQNHRQRQIHQSQPRRPSKHFSHIRSHCQVIQLNLQSNIISRVRTLLSPFEDYLLFLLFIFNETCEIPSTDFKAEE